MTAGGSTTVTATITRAGGYAGSVDVSVEGAPTGVTTSVAPTTIASGATTATITLNVAANATAATTTLTVRAKGSGVSAATSSFALTTQAAQANNGSFALSMNPATLSVAAGANATSTITIARTAPFTGAVNLAVTGAPAGVTATLSSASVSGTSATLTVAVAAGTAATTANLTVTGTATGVTTQSSSVALTTTAATGGTGNVVWRFCDGSTVPWFAVQDGNGAWTRVVGTNNTFSFNLTNDRGGVAYVVASGTTASNFIYYGNRAEVTARGVQQCPSATAKTVNGTVAGVGTTDQAWISLGTRVTTVVPAAGTSFSLKGVADGPHDLIAGRTTVAFNGTSVSTSLAKVIVRRNQNPADNATLPVLDFGTSEAFTPSTATATISNLGADQSIVNILYTTSNGTIGSLYSDASFGGASRSFSGIPSAQQATGDLHLLSVSALASTALTDPIAAATLRSTAIYFSTLGNQTVALGPALSTPTVTSASTAPYARLRAVLTRQTEYNQYFMANFQQSGTTARTAQIEATVTWVGSGSFDVTVPDFSGVAGWDNSWGFKTGVNTIWFLNASGWSAGTNGSQNAAAGVTAQSAQKAGQLTP